MVLVAAKTNRVAVMSGAPNTNNGKDHVEEIPFDDLKVELEKDEPFDPEKLSDGD